MFQIILKLKLIGIEIAKGYSSVVFLNSAWVGAGLLGASFIQSNSGFCGLLGILSASLLLSLLGIKKELLRQLILYNGLLTGLFVGYLFQLDGLVILVVAIGVFLSLFITVFLDSALHRHGLPILSLPFVLTAITLALAKPQLTHLTDATPYFIEHSLGRFETFFRSMGSIFCIPDPLFGAVVVAAIFLKSPLLGLLFSMGFLLGSSCENLLRIESLDLHFTHFFNYSLIFSGISVVFLRPSRWSFGLACMGTMLASFIALASLTFWGIFRIPIVPFPFNLTVILMIVAARWIWPGNLKGAYAGTPEATLEKARLFRLRQCSGEIGLFCPFLGEWVIQQGFNGEWTHRGNWKHALDFVVYGRDGKTFKDQGFSLEDYHCFGKPILSPIEGYVFATCSDQADNLIGTVDNQKNWGNYLILGSELGYYVVLAHLKKDSIQVKVGARVSVGAQVAECGNSGYSQEPHLHMQVQWSAVLGGFTAPFHLLNYRKRIEANLHQLHFNGLPVTGEAIEPFPMNLTLDRAIVFKIGEILKFKLSRVNHEKVSSLEINIAVKLDENSGLVYLSDGVSRLYFGRSGAQHYFYGFEGRMNSPLADLLEAGPRIPFIFGCASVFNDVLPLEFSSSKLSRWIFLVKELLGLSAYDQFIQYRFNPDQLELVSHRTYLKLDPSFGIFQFKVGKRNYERLV